MFIRRVFPSFLPVNPVRRKFKLKHSKWTAEKQTIDGIYILFQDGAIPLPLHLSKTDVYIDLLL
jgi:hypothetical protein